METVEPGKRELESDKATTERTERMGFEGQRGRSPHRETERGHHGQDKGANAISKKTVRAARGDRASAVLGQNLKVPQKPSQTEDSNNYRNLNDH